MLLGRRWFGFDAFWPHWHGMRSHISTILFVSLFDTSAMRQWLISTWYRGLLQFLLVLPPIVGIVRDRREQDCGIIVAGTGCCTTATLGSTTVNCRLRSNGILSRDWLRPKNGNGTFFAGCWITILEFWQHEFGSGFFSSPIGELVTMISFQAEMK